MNKNKIYIPFLLGMSALILLSCNKSAGSSKLSTTIDSVSYAIGIDIGSNITRSFNEANFDLIIRGILDKQDTTSENLIQEDVLKTVIQGYFSKKQEKEYSERVEKDFAKVKEDGEKFMEENKTKNGIVTTPSGLQYIVIKNGSGKKPIDTSTVKVHYHGTTIDGEVFDSSVDRKEPVSFRLDQVIKGWTEGVQLMTEGSKFKFFVPQDLAYGSKPPGQGQGAIKPFMPLIFEVELIKIEK